MVKRGSFGVLEFYLMTNCRTKDGDLPPREGGGRNWEVDFPSERHSNEAHPGTAAI